MPNFPVSSVLKSTGLTPRGPRSKSWSRKRSKSLSNYNESIHCDMSNFPVSSVLKSTGLTPRGPSPKSWSRTGALYYDLTTMNQFILTCQTSLIGHLGRALGLAPRGPRSKSWSRERIAWPLGNHKTISKYGTWQSFCNSKDSEEVKGWKVTITFLYF